MLATHVQVVQHLQPGGIESMALDLCQYSEVGKNALIVSLEGTKSQALKQWPRLKPFAKQLRFLNKPKGRSLSTLMSLSALLKQHSVERIHTHHIGPMLYGGLAARMARVPQWIHTEHDAWHLQNRNHRRLAGWCFSALRPCLVADARLVARQIQEQLPGTQTEVIYNGIDTRRFSPGDRALARLKLNLPKTEQLIGCAARLHPVKGQHRLIKLLTRFPENVHLALAGAGETKDALIELCRTLDVLHRVHFLGAVCDMPSFYRAIDVFCLTSDAEGLPLAPLEAQACNTPAIVTDVGGARETVSPDTGSVVALDDEFELIRAVAKTFSLPEAASSRRFVLDNYDVQKMTEEYTALAEKVWSTNKRVSE